MKKIILALIITYTAGMMHSCDEKDKSGTSTTNIEGADGGDHKISKNDNTIVATFKGKYKVGSEHVGDCAVFLFEDSNGKTWDFISGDNNFGKYNSDDFEPVYNDHYEEIKSSKYMGEKFEIIWGTELTYPMCDGEGNEKDLYPFIMNLKLIDKRETVQKKNFNRSYHGTIHDKYEIEMNLTRKGDELSGSYKYKSQNTSLSIKGVIDEKGNLTLHELNEKGDVSGLFKGTVEHNQIKGVWSKSDGSKLMSFKLIENGDSPTGNISSSRNGTYKYSFERDNGNFGDGSLIIEESSAESFKFTIEIYYNDEVYDEGYSGGISGIAKVSAGHTNKARYSDEYCEDLEFTFSGNTISLGELNCEFYHGMGIWFDNYDFKKVDEQVINESTTTKATVLSVREELIMPIDYLTTAMTVKTAANDTLVFLDMFGFDELVNQEITIQYKLTSGTKLLVCFDCTSYSEKIKLWDITSFPTDVVFEYLRLKEYVQDPYIEAASTFRMIKKDGTVEEFYSNDVQYDSLKMKTKFYSYGVVTKLYPELENQEDLAKLLK
tara:strand:+ start:1447 stop:3090 length:1644 start_codon:yes stop_codon:yes gene_type:complete